MYMERYMYTDKFGIHIQGLLNYNGINCCILQLTEEIIWA